MNIGISFELIDLDRQAPNRNIRESKYFWDELYTLVAASGFHAVEIPYEPKWDFGGRSGIPRSNRSISVKFGTPSQYLSALREAGIETIAGLHFDPSLFLSENIDRYFGAFHHFAVEAIEFASSVEAQYITITVTPAIGALQRVCPSNMSWDTFSSSFLKRTGDLIGNLAEVAEEKGIRLCLKNEYWTLVRGELIIPFIKSITNKVYLDIDTANLQIARTDAGQMIRENKDRIGCVHYTDTAFVDDADYYKQPMPEYPAGRATQVIRDIGHGNIDFTPITDALVTSGYNGWTILNAKHTRDYCRALLRMRHFVDHKLNQKRSGGL